MARSIDDVIELVENLTGETFMFNEMFDGFRAMMEAVIDHGITLPAWAKAELLDQFEPDYYSYLRHEGEEYLAEEEWQAYEVYPKFLAMEPVLKDREPRTSWDMPFTDISKYK